MNYSLLIDFGSTYTKLTAVDLDRASIIGTSKSYTTINSTIKDGFEHAKKDLLLSIGDPSITFNHYASCSSAKGGFKMIAIGLSPTLTAEAAKRAALGAGTRILKIYSYGLSHADLNEINDLEPDVILLSGGTNGGNVQGIISDAETLTGLTDDIPIVVAGNQDAYPEIATLFEQSGHTFYLTENVMPQVNILNPLPVREILRDIFMTHIIEAKGMNDLESEIGNISMPTPSAVLSAAALLANGTENQSGLGDLLVIDIGGATTDIHSIGTGRPTHPDIRLEGLQEPNEKRTVEGDLGMRYSAESLLHSVGNQAFQEYLTLPIDEITEKCQFRAQHPSYISNTKEDIAFDNTLAKIAIETALNRHAGTYRREPTPNRVLLFQTGKDLQPFKTVIGTGGILVHNNAPLDVLSACLKKEQDPYLKPVDPCLYLDASYLLSSMGLLAQTYPDIALTILKRNLKKINATS